MVNRSKDRGTRAETALVGWLEDELGVEVMRRSQYGGGDRGDLVITSVPYMCEVKNRKRASIDTWGIEVERQCRNAGVEHGALIWSPPRLGPASINRWIVFEWYEHGRYLGRWERAGASVFTGPLAQLPAAMNLIGDRPGLWRLDDDYRYLWRARRADVWLEDLREHVITCLA